VPCAVNVLRNLSPREIVQDQEAKEFFTTKNPTYFAWWKVFPVLRRIFLSTGKSRKTAVASGLIILEGAPAFSVFQ
jgi:hypothetical protein